MNRNARSFACILAIAAATLLASADAANFSITRVALSFDGEKPAVVVERDDKLTAQAEISFTGNGLLRGAWEIAGPNPDGDKPQYRTLSQVQQHLAGRDAASLNGPRLPTESSGAYLIRLRITEPTLNFEAPVIRYSVIEKKN